MFALRPQVPQAAEAAEAARMRAAASTVQRWWRRRRWQLAVEARRAGGSGSAAKGDLRSLNSGNWGCKHIFVALNFFRLSVLLTTGVDACSSTP